MPKQKRFHLDPDQIKPLAQGRGACLATDRITVDGERVGYMYREVPDTEFHSGWCFMAGDETHDYMDNSENIAIYDVNTIANYDPEIIPFLDAPYKTAFARNAATGDFEEVEYPPME